MRWEIGWPMVMFMPVLPVSTFDDELRFRIARAIYGHSSAVPLTWLNAAFRLNTQLFFLKYWVKSNPPVKAD